MTLTPQDDFPHGRGTGDSWQENYLFMGMDDEHRAAMFVHVARLPALGTCDVKLAVLLDGEVASCTIHHPLGVDLDVPGFHFEIEDPWYRWRVTAEGHGMLGGAPGLLITTGEGDVPIAVDFQWVAKVAPVIQSKGFEELDSAGSGSSGHHYIQGGRWTGTVRLGDTTASVSGPSIRDHTWGERHVVNMDHCWWTPMSFDDGAYQLGGIDMHTFEGSRATFSFQRDASGQVAFPFLDVEITEGDAASYTKARIRCGDGVVVDAERVFHMPIAYYRGGGVGWVSDDALCTLRTADGRTGFGIIERNRILTDDEVAHLPITQQ